jgi:uncharacterized protein YjbI with pentapeptide repeats
MVIFRDKKALPPFATERTSMLSGTEPTRSTHPWRNRLTVFVLLHVIASGKTSFAADFSDANLTGAHLTNVDFRGTNLSRANLTGADLSGSDFRETDITQSQLNSACGYGTKLPAGLRIQPCFSEAETAGTKLRMNIDQALREAEMQMQRPQQSAGRSSSSSRVDVSAGAGRQ